MKIILWILIIGYLQPSEQRIGSLYNREIGYGDHPYHRSWSLWSSWSHCSRTCGGGIIMRTRLCRRRMGVVITDKNQWCPGETIEYRICNTQDCSSDSLDFLEYQCSLYNNRLVAQEIVKEWIPYKKGWNKCELKCQAKDSSKHYSFGKALDGTRCSDDFKDICVNGRCLSVGCDGKIGSDAKLDVCGICGGRNKTCVYYRNVFLDQSTKPEYKEVTNIPSGATHVQIRETSYNNMLALMDSKYQYIINGPGVFSYPGQYYVTGTVINYSRLAENKETITIPGPTNQHFLVLALLRETNPGIYYEYWLPKDKAISITPVSFKFHQPTSDHLNNRQVYRGWDPDHSNIYNYENHLRYKNRNEITTSIPNTRTHEVQVSKNDPSSYHKYQVDNLNTRQWNDVNIKIIDKTGERIPLTNRYSSTNVPIISSTADILKNISMIEEKRKERCSKCRKVKNLPKHFCRSDFAFRAEIVEKKKLEDKFRYELHIIQSYKNNIPIQSREYLWTQSKCRCPKLRLTKEYIIMGYTEYSNRESRLVVDKKCYVRRYTRKKSHTLLKLRRYNNCSKVN